MKNKKIGKIVKIVFVIVLIIIILYTFSGSADEIIQQLKETSLKLLLMIAAASVIYHLFEGWITYSLAKRYNPDFKYRMGVECAFYTSFYRLSTLGSAQGVAAIVFLGKHGVGYSEATGLYTIQYMMHKVCIAILSGMLFLVNWKVMSVHYRSYAGYLILAYVLTVLISIGLVLFATFPKFHILIIWLIKKFNKNGRLDGALSKMTEMASVLEKSSKQLLTDVKTMIGLVLKSLVKLCFWYAIPFLVLGCSGQITLLDSLSVTSLSVMTAAVIPTPAGIGSSELILTALFSVLVGSGKAAAITVLYRAATFIFPFVVGGIMIVIVNAARKRIAMKDNK